MIDADGHVGRGLRKHWRFWRDYELAAVARTDTVYDASPSRLHEVDAFVAPAKLAEWRRGRGGLVGHNDWGIWRRRTRPIPPRPFGRLDLGTGIAGTLDHPDALVVAPRGHAPGHVFFGPGMIFPPGRYRASFDVKLSGGPVAPDEKLCNFDVWDGVAVTSEEPLAADEWLDQSHVLSAFLAIKEETQGRPIELRLHCRGLVDVVVARGAIEPCEGECGEGVVLDRPM